jgi:hypothetical protein
VARAHTHRDAGQPLRNGRKMVDPRVMSVYDFRPIPSKLLRHGSHHFKLRMPLFVEFDHRYSGAIEFAPEKARAKQAIDGELVTRGVLLQCEIDGHPFEAADIQRLH